MVDITQAVETPAALQLDPSVSEKAIELIGSEGQQSVHDEHNEPETQTDLQNSTRMEDIKPLVSKPKKTNIHAVDKSLGTKSVLSFFAGKKKKLNKNINFIRQAQNDDNKISVPEKVSNADINTHVYRIKDYPGIEPAFDLLKGIPYAKRYLCGSAVISILKRKELAPEKDLDFFLVCNEKQVEEVSKKIKEHGFNSVPCHDGRLFYQVVSFECHGQMKERHIDCFCVSEKIEYYSEPRTYLINQAVLRGFTISALFVYEYGENFYILDPEGCGRDDVMGNILRMCKGVSPDEYFKKDFVNVIRAIQKMAEGYKEPAVVTVIHEALCALKPPEDPAEIRRAKRKLGEINRCLNDDQRYRFGELIKRYRVYSI